MSLAYGRWIFPTPFSMASIEKTCRGYIVTTCLVPPLFPPYVQVVHELGVAGYLLNDAVPPRRGVDWSQP